jgi:hypothetical protein
MKKQPAKPSQPLRLPWIWFFDVPNWRWRKLRIYY